MLFNKLFDDILFDSGVQNISNQACISKDIAGSSGPLLKQITHSSSKARNNL